MRSIKTRKEKGRKLQDQDILYPGPVHMCTKCGRDLSCEYFMVCGDCIDVELCFHCFSIGTETKTHRNYHNFYLMQPDDSEGFELGWSKLDEYNFVESLTFCGITNWELVSEYMRTKTPKECKKHFKLCYLDSPIAPIPSNKDRKKAEHKGEANHEKNKKKTITSELGKKTFFNQNREESAIPFLPELESFAGSIMFLDTDTSEIFQKKLEYLQKYDEAVQIREKFVLSHSTRNDSIPPQDDDEAPRDISRLALYCKPELFSQCTHALNEEAKVLQPAIAAQNSLKVGAISKKQGELFFDSNAIHSIEPSKEQAYQWNTKAPVRALDYETTDEYYSYILDDNSIQFCKKHNISPTYFVEMRSKIFSTFPGPKLPKISEIQELFPGDYITAQKIVSFMQNVYSFYNIDDITK